jgi:hypothetical protein
MCTATPHKGPSSPDTIPAHAQHYHLPKPSVTRTNVELDKTKHQ